VRPTSWTCAPGPAPGTSRRRRCSGHTYTPDSPLLVDEDWPFRRIDHVLVRCAEHGGAALRIRDCRVVGDDLPAGDHSGLVADLGPR
jgi:hypothetical protein